MTVLPDTVTLKVGSLLLVDVVADPSWLEAGAELPPELPLEHPATSSAATARAGMTRRLVITRKR